VELLWGDDFVLPAVVGDFYARQVVLVPVETKEKAEGGEFSTAGGGGVVTEAGEVVSYKVVVQFFAV